MHLHISIANLESRVRSTISKNYIGGILVISLKEIEETAKL